MRSNISFSVYGDDYEEIVDAALRQYRDLLGNQDARLPWATTIEISPNVLDGLLDGSNSHSNWRAEVVVHRKDDDE